MVRGDCGGFDGGRGEAGGVDYEELCGVDYGGTVGAAKLWLWCGWMLI